MTEFDTFMYIQEKSHLRLTADGGKEGVSAVNLLENFRRSSLLVRNSLQNFGAQDCMLHDPVENFVLLRLPGAQILSVCCQS